MRSLITGFENADRPSQIRARLDELPSDLMDLFAHMLEHIEPHYRKQAALNFSVALSSDYGISLSTYSFFDDMEFADDENAPTGVLSVSEIRARNDQMRKQLNARCKGLLEVRDLGAISKEPYNYDKHFIASTVQFLHLTARDFISTRSVQKTMRKWLETEVEVNVRVCQAICNQIKRFDFDEYTGRFGLCMCETWAVHAGLIRDVTSQKIIFDQLASIAAKYPPSQMESLLESQADSALEVWFIAEAVGKASLYDYTIQYLDSHREIFEYGERQHELVLDGHSHSNCFVNLFVGWKGKTRGRFLKYYYQNLRISSLKDHESAFKATILEYDPKMPKAESGDIQLSDENEKILKVFEMLTPSNLRDCSVPEQLHTSHHRIRELLETDQCYRRVSSDIFNELCLCKEEEASREVEQEEKEEEGKEGKEEEEEGDI